jgi:hypothetical protein
MKRKGVLVMEILFPRDLIVDDKGNYYFGRVNENSKEIILNNAYMVLAWNLLFPTGPNDDSFIPKYKNKPIGLMFNDELQGIIEECKSDKYPRQIFTLDEVQKEYKIYFQSFYSREYEVK